jgi:hypothetical protein
MINWSQACTAQLNRPLWQQQQANCGGCLFAVSDLRCLSALLAHASALCSCRVRSCRGVSLTLVPQVVSFALSAVYSGVWFTRWVRESVKKRMWAQLGWFSGLVCAGSVVGAVAWGAELQANALTYEGNVPGLNAQQGYALASSSYRWEVGFLVIYPVEFLCFIVPKLMMLGRLTNNAARSLQVYAQEQSEEEQVGARVGALALVQRVTSAAVVLCGVGGMVALDVAAAHQLQAAGVFDQAAAACDAQGNDTVASLALNNQANAINSSSNTSASVQGVFEAIALLLISTAYLILVPLSVAMFRRAERVGARALLSAAARSSAGGRMEQSAAAVVDETVQAAAQQRRRLVVACVVVLVTFPCRAAYDLLSVYSNLNNQFNPACGQCDPCQSDRFLIGTWLYYTPEFFPVVIAFSSPLPMCVSLWIITGAHAQAYAISLNILRARLGRQTANANRTPLPA